MVGSTHPIQFFDHCTRVLLEGGTQAVCLEGGEYSLELLMGACGSDLQTLTLHVFQTIMFNFPVSFLRHDLWFLESNYQNHFCKIYTHFTLSYQICENLYPFPDRYSSKTIKPLGAAQTYIPSFILGEYPSKERGYLASIYSEHDTCLPRDLKLVY